MMNSTELKNSRTDFSEWYPLNEEGVKQAPKEQGVYVIRKSRGQCFWRLRGQSDIFYMGSTIAKGGLKQRLSQYLHPGPSQLTNIRINKLLNKYEMEVAWCTCNEPGNLEHQLLRQYVEEHDELPPLNHASPRSQKKVFDVKIHSGDNVNVKKL